MSTFDYGTGVSRTLQPEFHGFDTIVFQDGKPVLDSELNLFFDVIADKFQKYISSQVQSGFLSSPSYVLDASWSNKFQLPADFAFVNGWQVNVKPNGDNFIYLSPVSLGSGNHRYDFVFLEVWKVMISGGATDYKPDATHIYKEGNVQNVTDTLPDDVIDPVIVAVYPETTKRVQIQYRIRIQEDVIAPNSQNSSIFDNITFAQGSASAPVDPFVFSNTGSSTGDYGLWRAGNGDNVSRAQLKSVDGYVYAIPVAIVFRRSQAPYIDEDLGGQQASDTQISDITSDRPDGLFYDSVVESDVIDLRHQVVQGKQVAYDEILRTALKDLLTGQNKTKRPVSINYDALSDVAITGYTIVGACDKTRSVISDLQTTVTSNVVRLSPGDNDSSQDFYTSAVASWQVGDTITVKAPAGSPSGTIILGTNDSNPATKPFVYGNSAGLTNVTGSWSNLGTSTATFTLSQVLVSQELWVAYDIQYPSNRGLSHVFSDVIKLDYVNAASFPTVQAAYTPHSGIVRAGADLLGSSLYLSRCSKQLMFSHAGAVHSYAANYQVAANNKQISVTPVISSTTTVNGSTRTLFVRNTSNTTRKLYLPFATNKTWMVRGVYTSQSGPVTDDIVGTLFYDQQPSAISSPMFYHPTSATQYSFATISSMVYVPTSTELISNGSHFPVFRQNMNGNIDRFILVDSNGVTYTPPSSNPADYRLSYKSIPTANIRAYTLDSAAPTDNWIQVRDDAVITDGELLWVDMDYIGEPHDGGQVKIAYKYLPYQGLVDTVSGIELDATLKSLSGYIHTDGTTNVGANIDRKTYPGALISLLPTPRDLEFLLKGDSIAGVVSLGKFNSNDVCNSAASLLEYADNNMSALKVDDVVTARFDAGLNPVERGGNEATALKSIMLLPMAVSNYRQVVVFGLAVAADNFAMKNELLLYTWTYTNNGTANVLTSADTTHIGVDFFFINKRPIVSGR